MATAALDKPKKMKKDLTFDNIDNGTIRLRTKPSAKMAYSFIPAHDHPASISAPGQLGGEPLLIFLSGLDNPKAVWQKTLDRLFESACAIGAELPPMLFYDRFGVGGSDPEPTDVGKPPEQFHDCADAVVDLHQLLVQLMELKFNWSRSVDADTKQPLPRIVFCAHSFGACVARMFAAAYPGIVQGVLIIDSAIAQYRAEDMYPDPDVPESWAQRHDGKSMWSKGGWPDESVISKEMCRDAIKKTRASPISGHPLTTRERMRWDHMPQQLPDNKGPKLRGPTAHLPLVTVMISDPDVSGPKQSQLLRIPEVLCRIGLITYCMAFHSGEPYLQPHGKGKGPILVHKAGHMVHLDAPESVARELLELVALSSHVLAQEEKNRKTKSKI